MSKALYLLGKALRVRTEQSLHPGFIVNYGAAAAYRAGLGDHNIIASGQVFCNLRDNHVGLVNCDCVANAQLQLPHNADVMHRSAAHSSTFQFHRLKNRYRIDKTCSGRAPLDFIECGFADFIAPLESDGISRKLGRLAKSASILNVIKTYNQSVGRVDIIFYAACKPLNGFVKV